MAIPDSTPNTQQFIALAGSTPRIMEADANGNVTASKDLITAKLSDPTVITLLTTDSNWNNAGAYIGTAITGTYEGYFYSDGTYHYYAYSDNAWRRWREASISITAKNGTANPSEYPLGITVMYVGSGQTGWIATYGLVLNITDYVGGRASQTFYQAVSPYGSWVRHKTSGADTWTAWEVMSGASGAGDMVLADVQSVTGLKTFDDTKLAMKGSSTGVNTIASANASGTNYTNTLPAKSGTFAMTSDIGGGSVSIGLVYALSNNLANTVPYF